MKRSWYREIIRRRVLIIFLLLLQIAFIVFVLRSDNPFVGYLSRALHAVGIYLAIYVIYKPDHTSSKTGWVFLLLLFPVAGTILYLLFHFQTSAKKLAEDIARSESRARPLFTQRKDALDQAGAAFPEYRNQFRYLQDHMGFPIYDQTEVKYYSPGEEFMPAFLSALEAAEHYIFLEYFIIGEGKMWEQILEILKRKAAQGVEVRVMYDDIGCFVTLPKGYVKTLESFGIKCSVFNPFRPVLSTIQNNRDHRKIAAVDGKVAFTGGLNLADEYINLYEKYGHWKDCAIRVEGKAAWSLTLMFLQMWDVCRKEEEALETFFPGESELPETDGFVEPYADNPLNDEIVGEQVYMQIINNAHDYLYITTPYGKTQILKDLNFTIPDGKFVVLIGPSGCGKTTTLKTINRLIEPDSGIIRIDGEDITQKDKVELRRHIGYVIQQIGLFPNMTVAQNIAVVPRMLKYDKQKCADIVQDMLKLIDMEKYAEKYPSELSGGQQQRIGVLRAFAASPPIVLMDEPFGALDPLTRQTLQDEIKRIQQKLHKTIVFVTHDMDEALKLADIIIFMESGTIVQMATPQEMLEHPATAMVSGFLGKHSAPNPANTKIRAFMRCPVMTAFSDDGVLQCAEMMARNRVDSLVITDHDGKYLGVVTIGDIHHWGRNLEDISSLVQNTAKTAHVDEEAKESFDYLLSSNANYVVVLNEDDTVAGLVTKTSVARSVAENLWGNTE